MIHSLAALMIAVIVALPAAAQQSDFGTGEALQLEGIVAPGRDVTGLGVLTIGAGDAVRRFAVTSARTPKVEGMSIFRQTELYPENLRLLGNAKPLERFRQAPAGTALRILGRLHVNRLLVSEISVVDPA